MKTEILRTGIATALLVILLMAAPASAVLLEESFMGTVSKIDQRANTLNIKADSSYSGEKWVPVAATILTGEVPDTLVFDSLKQGDAVQVTRIGGEGGSWIAIGKIGSVSLTEKYLTDSFGDPSRLISEFFEGYRVNFTTTPDCNTCAGTTCTALSAEVIITQKGGDVGTIFMTPGQTVLFKTPAENQYDLKITFVRGEASSASCERYGAMAGPQPISNFVIHEVKKGAVIPTETATESPTQPPVTPATLPPTTVPPTQSPGFAGLLSVLGLIAAVCLFCHHGRE